MDDKKRVIYVPKERKSVLLRVSSGLFCIGTALMWITRDKFGFEKGDLLIMTGIAVLLITLSLSGRRAENRAKADSDALKRIREDINKDDFSDGFFRGK